MAQLWNIIFPYKIEDLGDGLFAYYDLLCHTPAKGRPGVLNRDSNRAQAGVAKHLYGNPWNGPQAKESYL